MEKRSVAQIPVKVGKSQQHKRDVSVIRNAERTFSNNI